MQIRSPVMTTKKSWPPKYSVAEAGPRLWGLKLVVLLLLVLMLSSNFPSAPFNTIQTVPRKTDTTLDPVFYLSEEGGTGSVLNGVSFMSRTFTAQELMVSNTYSTPSVHAGQLDLSSYLISGWHLYRVTMNVGSIVASPERAVAGVTPQTYENFVIGKVSFIVYNQLAQGFYKRSHDGRLLNYSLYYDSPTYDPSTYGTAYFVIRSSPSSPTNMSTHVPITDNGGSPKWVIVSTVADSVTLSANTEYFVVIDGRALKTVEKVYPLIRWRAEDSAGTFSTPRYNANYSAWELIPYEALLRYTYVAWNTTSGSPLTFSSPSAVSLTANSTPLSGLTWSFNSASKNITFLQFNSNMSVAINYNLTLWYSKSITTTTLWRAVGPSSSTVSWNQSLSLNYPSISTGTVVRFVNLTRMTDWTPTGLYLGASNTDHDEYTVYGKTVTCAHMSSGDWTMVYSAHNYVTSIVAASMIRIDNDLSITAYIRDSSSVPVSSGSSNLTIRRGNSIIVSPPNETEPDGVRYYLWNIDATTSLNGRYRTVVYWTNGTEAGYRSVETIVYYPTSLSSAQSRFYVVTDSSFEVRVDYIDTFNTQGLTSPAATVHYSFNGHNNVLMTDLGNGTWTTVISTSGLRTGLYSLNVTAFGWALQNQTLTIPVTVSYGTQPLIVTWPDGNSITYTDSVRLFVEYRMHNGTLITGADVNVTIGSDTWPLRWSGSYYAVTLNSTQIQAIGLGTHLVTIEAWRADCIPQTEDTSLTISEATSSIIVVWTSETSPDPTDLTYAEFLYITVEYTHESTPISDAYVRLVVNGAQTYNMTLGGDNKWHLQIRGGDLGGLGNWSCSIIASRIGYETKTQMRYLMVVVDNSVAVPSWLSTDLYYNSHVYLDLTLQDSFGRPVADALVSVSYRGTNYTLRYMGSGLYRIVFNGSDGLGTYPLRLFTHAYGFTNHTLDLTLKIVPMPTDLDISLEFRFNGILEDELYLDSSVTIRAYCTDAENNTLSGMNLLLKIGSYSFFMIDHGNGTYTFTIPASVFGLGTAAGNVSLAVYGYTNQTVPFELRILPIPTHVEIIPLPSTMYLNQTIYIQIRYVNSHTGMTIAPLDYTFTWPVPGSVRELEPGLYEYVLSSQSLSLTVHLLIVRFTQANYSVAELTVPVTVRAVYTTLYTATSFRNYEYELVSLYVIYRDIDHYQDIWWAVVIATINGRDYVMEYVGAGMYRYSLNLTFAPMTYVVTFHASATGCYSNSTTASVIVDAKRVVYIVLSDIRPVQGQAVAIGAYLFENGTDNPLQQATLDFTVIARLANGTQLTHHFSAITNSQGYASQAYTVPRDAVSLTVIVRYAGTNSIMKASFTSASITVSPPSLIQQLFEFLTGRVGLPIIIALLVMSSSAAYYNRRRRVKKRTRRQRLESQIKEFRDLGSLRHFMAVYANRGTCVFYYPFTEQRIQADLISGFISAVTSVYGEITGEGEQGRLEEIQYQGLRVNSYSGRFIIGILILEGEMSKQLRERLQMFVELFERQFGRHLEDWNGLIDYFDTEWIVSTLHSTLGFTVRLPHRVVLGKRLGGISGKVYHMILQMVDSRGEVLIGDILGPIANKTRRTEAEILDVILGLREREVLIPVSIPTLLQRQEMTTAGTICETAPPAPPAPAEPVTPKEPTPTPPIPTPSTPTHKGRKTKKTAEVARPTPPPTPPTGTAPETVSTAAVESPSVPTTTEQTDRGPREKAGEAVVTPGTVDTSRRVEPATTQPTVPTSERAGDTPAPSEPGPVPSGPVSSPVPSLSEGELFVREVEALMEREARESKPADETEAFVREVEELMKKEKKKKTE